MAKKERDNSIHQPQGKTMKCKGGSYSLHWDDGFSKKYKGKINTAQVFVDSECIRLMSNYTPMLTGVLTKSATLGTVLGEGEIHQTTPYARYQYYGKLMVSSTTGSAFSKGESKELTDKDLNYNKSRHPLAGSYWFKRMAADNGKKILAGAQRKASGK